MKKILVSFLLILTLVCNSPMCAYASSFGGGGGTHDMTGFNNWDTGDKVAFWSTNLPAIIAGSIGLVINPLNWNYDTWLTTFLQSANSMGVALESDNYYDYVANMLSVNNDNELVVNDELTDIMYNASVQYIEENIGFRTHLTLDSTQYLKANVDKFITNSQYNAYLNYCKEHSDLVFYGNMSTSNFTLNGVTYNKCFYFFEIDVTETDFTWYYNYMYGFQNEFYDKDWQKIALNRYIVTQDGDVLLYDSSTLQGKYPMHGYFYNTSYNNAPLYLYYPYESINGIASGYTPSLINITSSSSSNFLHSYKVQNLRLYDSLADLKNYSAGNRPYYVTETFTNYDSTVDNSTTITQTEIDNSITYGDVYNYITNNYENPDGLSEDELRAILAEYLSQINNNSGSGSGGGSGDSGGSGSGLSGFLDGLGSLGDALLAIIGKLLEYVGKAIELLSGTVTKVIDLVPTTITAILGAIFSFFPQEWMTAIELALVLGVVIGIVGLLRK